MMARTQSEGLAVAQPAPGVRLVAWLLARYAVPRGEGQRLSPYQLLEAIEHRWPCLVDGLGLMRALRLAGLQVVTLERPRGACVLGFDIARPVSQWKCPGPLHGAGASGGAINTNPQEDPS